MSEAQTLNKLWGNDLVRHLSSIPNLPTTEPVSLGKIKKALEESNTVGEFIAAFKDSPDTLSRAMVVQDMYPAFVDLNEARAIVGKPPFPEENWVHHVEKVTTRKKRPSRE